MDVFLDTSYDSHGVRAGMHANKQQHLSVPFTLLLGRVGMHACKQQYLIVPFALLLGGGLVRESIAILDEKSRPESAPLNKRSVAGSNCEVRHAH